MQKIDNVSRGIDKLQVRTATVQQRISQNNERSFLIAVLRGGGGGGRFDKSIMFCLRFNSNHCLQCAGIALGSNYDEELNRMQSLSKEMFIINCKNYEEVSGKKIRRLVKTVERVSKKYNVRIVLAPPQHLVGLVTEMDSSVMILAQHVDDSVVGSTTGFVVPELLKKSKVGGSIINHSEHRIPNGTIQRLVSKLKELKMISVLCVKNTAEVKRYAKFDADYIAIEPPELIGSGKAISKQRPELITKAASILKDTKSSSKLLCGAGIVSGADVAKAMELGSVGILVASGIVKAENWEKIISEFSRSMAG